MRTARVFTPQSRPLRPSMMFRRAPTFSEATTESSRSRKTRSASLAAALAIIFGLTPGVESSLRRRRLLGMVGPLFRGRCGVATCGDQIGSDELHHGFGALIDRCGVPGDDADPWLAGGGPHRDDARRGRDGVPRVDRTQEHAVVDTEEGPAALAEILDG